MTDEPRPTRPPRAPETPPAAPVSSGPPASHYAGLGLQLAAVVGVFTYAGWWLDRRLGTTPWLTLVMVFVGAGGGLYSIYRKVFPASGDARPPR
jgi:ATP synthase protein I